MFFFRPDRDPGYFESGGHESSPRGSGPKRIMKTSPLPAAAMALALTHDKSLPVNELSPKTAARQPAGEAGSGKDDDDVLQWVKKARGGDLEAFEHLVSRFQQGIFGVALYKSKNYFDAEDLTQDIFMAAFRALPTLQVPENFSSWLFGIAYNRCHKWFRRERTKVVKFTEIKRRVADAERQRSRAPAHSGARVQLDGHLYQPAHTKESHLSEELRRLPAEIRQVLTLKYLEGYSYEEIAGEVGINANRIDYLIRKGKQLLRARLPRDAEARGE